MQAALPVSYHCSSIPKKYKTSDTRNWIYARVPLVMDLLYWISYKFAKAIFNKNIFTF